MFKLWRKIKRVFSPKPEYDVIRLLSSHDEADMLMLEILAWSTKKKTIRHENIIGGKVYRIYEIIQDRVKYVIWFSIDDYGKPFCLSRKQVEELFSC